MRIRMCSTHMRWEPDAHRSQPATLITGSICNVLDRCRCCCRLVGHVDSRSGYANGWNHPFPAAALEALPRELAHVGLAFGVGACKSTGQRGVVVDAGCWAGLVDRVGEEGGTHPC